MRLPVAALATILLAAAPAYGSVSIGSKRVGAPESGCATATAFTALACTFSQASIRPDRVAPGGMTSPITGVAVGWSLELRYTGNVTSAKAKLRTVQGNFGAGSGEEQTLPLSSSTYSFPARLPILAGDRIGVDTTVTTGAAGGSLDVVSPETGAGAVDKWVPPLPDGITATPSEPGSPNKELLLSAQVEADIDGDEFGDESQDKCPTDKSLQGPCGPRVSLAGKKTQRLGSSVVVQVSCNEACSLTGSGKISTSEPRQGKTIKLKRRKLSLAANAAGKLKLKLPKKSRARIRRSLTRGGKATARVTIVATGASGDVVAAKRKIKLKP